MGDLISVIVPVYNVGKYVRQTLDSIVNQTYGHLEILVIDDGSTDGSSAICDEYLKDDRVKVFHRQNAGVAASRQFGVETCRGTYFVTLDADDYVSADFVEKLYDAIIRNVADVSVCGVSCFSDGQNGAYTVYMPYGSYEKLMVTREALGIGLYTWFGELLLSDAWNKMYRTQFVRDSGVKFQLPNIYNGNELKFNLNLALHCPIYATCKESLLFHRVRQGSRVQRKDKPLQEGFEIITESLIEESKRLGLSLKEQLSNVYYWLIGNVVMDIIHHGGDTRERHGRYNVLIRRNRQFLKKHQDNLDQHRGMTSFKLGDSAIHLPAFVLSNALWLDAASMGIIALRTIKYRLMSLQMGNFDIRKALRASGWFSRLYYGLHVDDLLVELGRDGFDAQAGQAMDLYLSDDDKKDSALLASLKKDMKRCYHQIKASPSEYFLLGLRTLTASERSEFLTDKFMYMTMGRLVPRKIHDLEIEDKFHFYSLAEKYFKRQCIGISRPEDYARFEKMVLSVHDVMLKPNNSSLGQGIEAWIINDKDEARKAFDMMMVAGGRWIVEERIHQCKEMAAWNETSCNSIRFMSFLNKDGFHAVTPLIRTGRKGTVVDNAGSGGLWANVDVSTGKISTCGMDKLGRRYECHPDSGLTFKGWQIPRYNELVKTVESMHREIMPSHPYIAWDMALTDAGWVVIECNWGQMCNQYIDHKGRRKEFLKYVYGNNA